MFCFEICTTRGEREKRKRRECKFQNKAHRTFDPRNTLSAVLQQYQSARSVSFAAMRRILFIALFAATAASAAEGHNKINMMRDIDVKRS